MRKLTGLSTILWMAFLATSVVNGANIAWVNEDRGGGGGDAGVGAGGLDWADSVWKGLLEGAGHTVIAEGEPYFLDIDLEQDRLDLLNSADLVIVTRDSNSGNYDESEDEIQLWTDGITVPMMIMTPYHMRSNRWRMVDATGVPLVTDNMEVLEPTHPIFDGVALDGNNEVEVWDGGLLGDTDNINLTDALDAGDHGQILAWEAGTEFPWVILWEKGVEFYPGSDTFAGNTRLFFAGGSDDDANTWGEHNLTAAGDQIFLNAISFLTGEDGGAPQLQPGDSDQDLDFDQLDLVKVQIAAKYLTGAAATWGEGDWNGAPGGEQGSPPAGNGFFDQLDIVSALGAGKYLTGPYAALAPGGGTAGDDQTSLVYDPKSGELSVDPPAGKELTSINITSAGSQFIGDKPAVLDGAFDNFAGDNIFKATFGGSFGNITFGNVLPAGMSEADVNADLTAVGSLAGGGDLGQVDLIFVPEPSALMLILIGLIGVTSRIGRR